MVDVFPTITSAHWARMFASHRAMGHYHGNAILAHIRARVAAKFRNGANQPNVVAQPPPAARGPVSFLSSGPKEGPRNALNTANIPAPSSHGAGISFTDAGSAALARREEKRRAEAGVGESLSFNP